MKLWITISITLLTITMATSQAINRPLTYSVAGDAILRVQPDQVVLRLGLETKGEDLVETKQRNHAIIAEAIRYCKDKGIPAKHIQTDYVSIRPHYNHRSDLKVSHYNVTQVLCLVIEDVPAYEQMLTDLLLLGINKVDNVEFRTTRIKEYRNEARKMAVAAAKEKAIFLTSEVGIQLGDILNVSDYSSTPSPSFSRANYANFSQNIAQDAGMTATEGGLSVGLLSIKANITLTYEIKSNQ